MKYDPFKWKEETQGVETEIPQGRLRLRLSRPAPVFITAQGYESLAGYGTEHDYTLAEEGATFRVDGDGDVRVFVYIPDRTISECLGERFTNEDRQPMESGALAEVTAAMRLFRLEQRQLRAEVAAERETLEALRKPLPESDEVAEDQQELLPESEPAKAKKKAEKPKPAEEVEAE